MIIRGIMVKKTSVKANKATLKKSSESQKRLPVNKPRGERSDYLKITITMDVEMLLALKALGLRRKANKKKDTDASSLIREAIADFLDKNKTKN